MSFCSENLIGYPWRGTQSIVTPCHITRLVQTFRVVVSLNVCKLEPRQHRRTRTSGSGVRERASERACVRVGKWVWVTKSQTRVECASVS